MLLIFKILTGKIGQPRIGLKGRKTKAFSLRMMKQWNTMHSLVWKVATYGMEVHLKDEFTFFMLGKLKWLRFVKGFILKEKLEANETIL